MGILSDIQEVIYKYEATFGHKPECLVMHPETRDALIKETLQHTSEPSVLEDMRCCGMSIETSPNCLPGPVFAGMKRLLDATL